MKTEVSLPHSQESDTCPYPEPDISSLCSHLTSRKSILILSPSPYLRLGLPSGILSSGLPTKTPNAPLLVPIHATCPAHLSRLDLITRNMFG